MKTIYTKIVHDYISSTHNKILSKQPPPIHKSETTLNHHTRRTFAQLRSNKSPFILSYLNKISPSSHPSPSCPLCQTHIHDTPHLFTCPKINTTLGPKSLQTDPARAAELIDHWTVLMGTRGASNKTRMLGVKKNTTHTQPLTHRHPILIDAGENDLQNIPR